MRSLPRLAVWTLPLVLLAPFVHAQQLCGEPIDEKWWIAPERDGWSTTSTSREVRTNLAALQKAHPDAFQLSTIGTSLRGRPIQLATVVRPPDDKLGKRLRALIVANIHGGEVEGKEAVQVILREIAFGGHADILAACDVWFVPIYNVDGNDEIRVGNRSSQNGPAAVGVRRNSQGLDLNRDLVKIESPESRALLGLFRHIDPHFYMDLHTTNGSAHGYQLTYAPSLSTNMDPTLDDFMHDTLIPQVRAAILKDHGFRIFDYGNFPGGGGEPGSWTTYAHTPRYAINYFGLRNRLSLLSEAYSYLPFRERALVTRAFVLESLRELVKHRTLVLALCAAADQRAMEGTLKFGYATRLRKAQRREVLVGSITHEGTRSVASKEFHAVQMNVHNRFESTKFLDYPKAWAIVGAGDAVRRALLLHDVQVHRLTESIEVDGESFAVDSKARPRVRYEGHALVTLRGTLTPGKRRLPKGTLIVFAHQRTARVAAQLLEGNSEDSLATWNFFDAQLAGTQPHREYPVLRVTTLPAWQTERILLRHGDVIVNAAYSPAPEHVPGNAIIVTIVCTKTGTRGRRGGYETNVRWRGRELVFGIGAETFSDPKDFGTAIEATLAKPPGKNAPILLQPGNTITNAELLRTAKMLQVAGANKIYLKHEPE